LVVPERRHWHICGRGCVGTVRLPPAWWRSQGKWGISAASPNSPWSRAF